MPFTRFLRLIDLQARMMLRADSAKFKLGWLWWLLEPLLFVAVFYAVFSIVLDSDRGDFLPFLMTGKFAFIWFSKTVLQASGSIVANKSLVSKTNIPKTLFPMAAVQEGTYRQIVVYLLLLCALVIWGYPVTSTWIWLIPVMFVYYLMIVAAALVGAYLVCILRDFSKAIPLGMTFFLFSSGVFWDVRDIANEEKMNLFLTLNPIAFILDAHRQLLMYDAAPDLAHLFYLGLVAGAIIIAMNGLMRRYNQYLAYKVLTS